MFAAILAVMCGAVNSAAVLKCDVILNLLNGYGFESSLAKYLDEGSVH